MSNERREEKALDAALSGGPPDEETQPLTDTAASLKQTLAVDVPPADRQRALFLSGVAAKGRARFSPLRVLVPALALTVVILAGFAGQSALPGQGLYPVREAMNSVGIGRSPVAEVDDHCKEAVALIDKAEDSIDTDPDEAIALAVLAIEQLGPARELLPELNGEQREEWIEWVEDLEEDAVEIITEAAEEENEGSDDSTGPGSDNSGSDDSGTGSDNSGSGSDDSGGDDNSGSGSDDSGADDNSGSGSDDSGGDDNSGSGSDDSGSGSDDSSGSGSGGSDDSSGSGSG